MERRISGIWFACVLYVVSAQARAEQEAAVSADADSAQRGSAVARLGPSAQPAAPARTMRRGPAGAWRDYRTLVGVHSGLGARWVLDDVPLGATTHVWLGGEATRLGWSAGLGLPAGRNLAGLRSVFVTPVEGRWRMGKRW